MSVNVLQLVVVLLAEALAAYLLVETVVVVITLLARMTAETVITTAVIVTDPAPQMTGKYNCEALIAITNASGSDRDVKEERDDSRENGTTGEDRKGELAIPMHIKNDIH